MFGWRLKGVIRWVVVVVGWYGVEEGLLMSAAVVCGRSRVVMVERLVVYGCGWNEIVVGMVLI